jgi:nucleotide-binding universal stress UspA family protein
MRVMYETVLVALDLSESSRRVVAAARDLAFLAKGEVWVFHLREREPDPRRGMVAKESYSEAQVAIDDEARAAIGAAVEALNRAGVKAHGEVRDAVFGHAARQIVEDAEEHGADVIVMGSRGRGDLAGLVLGSTAHKVIRLADRPVLVVP